MFLIRALIFIVLAPFRLVFGCLRLIARGLLPASKVALTATRIAVQLKSGGMLGGP
jgi:hypothetical protein